MTLAVLFGNSLLLFRDVGNVLVLLWIRGCVLMNMLVLVLLCFNLSKSIGIDKKHRHRQKT